MKKRKVVTIEPATQPKPGTYHEALRWVSEQVKPAGAILFVINGVRGTGWECMGAPEIIAEMPRLIRKIADDIEHDAGIKKVSGGRQS
jgi:hypothetical protein